MTIFEQITTFLRHNLAEFTVINHEPVFTSEEAARVRGLEQSTGAKSLLVKADHQFILAIIPGSSKLDTKKLKNLFDAKDIRFATPDEVKEIMHCEIGACFPFGNLIDVPMIVDEKMGQNEMIAFNPGVHNRSIKISWEDYQKAVSPRLEDITKESV